MLVVKMYIFKSPNFHAYKIEHRFFLLFFLTMSLLWSPKWQVKSEIVPVLN